MFLSDQWAERQILDAQSRGEFDNLPGAGAPLVLDDDSGVPRELRVAYRILKNAGYVPAEIQDRKEALDLQTLLEQVAEGSDDHVQAEKRLKVLRLRLQQAGMNTDFLDDRLYREKLQNHLNGA
ncbi:DnaJ family domain-containing protein [Rouxiella badensis]|jgi:hypothetical protein|uniref:DnaJ family domain-containing protein n=1 Tax=Rouxiella badensis TaxID=1646377 RepID=UPI0017880C5F|nr:DnaJ family domain-containing protein [Rouxiella badensis]QOI56751.1 DUF1992 domain-containing protein [Rouxiella badensis subsp. acadiensis]